MQVAIWCLHLQNVYALQVVVPPVLPHDPASGICVDPSTPVASLPLPEQGFSVCGGFQLLSPEPHKVLEADRSELFEVAMPAAAAVAVGCDELGWQELQAAGSTGAAASCCEDKTRRCSSSRSSNNVTVAGADNHSQLGLFRGMVVVPRSANCFVAAQFAGAVGQHWLPIVRLRVVPQVRQDCNTHMPDPWTWLQAASKVWLQTRNETRNETRNDSQLLTPCVCHRSTPSL